MKYKCVNKTLADLALGRYTIITSHLASLRTAYECGDATAVTKLTEQIKDVAQCDDKCDCTTGDPILITGTGGSSSGGNIYNVVSAGNGLNVSTSVSGSTTTYTLALTASILADIAAATATSSVISSDSSITVTPSASTSTNTQYDIKIPPSTPIVPPKEFMVMKLEIDNQGNTSGHVFTPKEDFLHQNPTNLKNPVSSPWTYSVYPTGSISETFKIKIENFQTSPNSTYKVDISSYFQEYSLIGTSETIDSDDENFGYKSLSPKVVKTDNGFFNFVFTRPGSSTYVKFGTISNPTYVYSKIYLTIKIYE